MAIILDERARAACAQRRAHGHDCRLYLRIERLQGRAGALAGSPEIINVSWMPHRWPHCTLVSYPAGDTVVYTDTRLARYLYWRDITISAWHFGPIAEPQVDQALIFQLREWERSHSAAIPPPAA